MKTEILYFEFVIVIYRLIIYLDQCPNCNIMSGNKVFNVFIASSGDITLERKIVNEVCSGITDSILPNPTGVSFKVIPWENIFNGSKTPEETMKRLADECDVLVCILFKRFSCLIDQTGPDSLKEFLLAYDSWKTLKKPKVLFYFNEVKDTDVVEEHRLNNVITLKEKLGNDRLFFYEDFSAPQEFCERMHDQLMKTVESI